MPPVIFYTFIAGAGMSVLRATLMILAFMAALLISKSRDLYNTLAMAALIILIVYPLPFSMSPFSFLLPQSSQSCS